MRVCESVCILGFLAWSDCEPPEKFCFVIDTRPHQQPGEDATDQGGETSTAGGGYMSAVSLVIFLIIVNCSHYILLTSYPLAKISVIFERFREKTKDWHAILFKPSGIYFCVFTVCGTNTLHFGGGSRL